MAADTYLEKAKESLASAQSELDNRRYNCSANRSYYACFQAAVFALLSTGARRSVSGKWRHEYVKGQFATELIHRHKRHPAELSAFWSAVISFGKRQTTKIIQSANHRQSGNFAPPENLC